MARPLKEGYRVGGAEKTSYALYFFGQNVFYGLIGLNVQVMFADVGITAAAVAVILLVTKIWDAVNDPLFGILIDKIRFKRGRFLPWLRISLPVITISSIFLFFLPASASPAAKIAWAIIGYVAWDMSYTLCDVPIFVLPTSMTDNIKERTGILAIGRYIATFGIIGVMVALPMVQARLGWAMTGLVLSILGAVTMIPLLFKGKERYIVRPEKEVTLKEMFRYVAGNKYLLIFYIGLFFSNLTNFAMTLGIFFARYNLGDQDLGTVISLAAALPMMVVGAFIPMITKKIDKFQLYFYATIINAALGVVRYFLGYSNFGLYMAAAVVQGIFAGITGVLVFMFTPDCLEYGTYHTGERAEGVAASVQTFFVKLIGSVAGPLAFAILAVFGFVSGETATQTELAKTGIFMCMTLFPAVGMFLSVIVLRFYKLRDKDVQVMATYNMGRISKEEAEAQLAEKYGPAAELKKMTVTQSE